MTLEQVAYDLERQPLLYFLTSQAVAGQFPPPPLPPKKTTDRDLNLCAEILL